MISDPEIGLVCVGTVVKIVDFGAFVSFDNGKEGLVHISEIAEERVKNVKDYLVEGEEVDIRLLIYRDLLDVAPLHLQSCLGIVVRAKFQSHFAPFSTHLTNTCL